MKILKIDLTNKKITEEPITKKLLENWLGGRGLAAYFYSQDVRKPNDPQNSVFIMSGAITGSALPSSSRLEVVSSSPLTGYYQASSAGGYFGAYLRSQGIMGLQLTGRAKNWVYLIVKNGGIQIKDAKGLKGKNVYELRKKLGSSKNRSVAMIGRGGENLVRFACLQFDNRAAGRTGTGWHFGFKKLKAIVVHKGQLPLEPEKSGEVKQLLKVFAKKRQEHEQKEDITSYCTPQYIDYACDNFVYPASNYRRNTLSEKEKEKIGYNAFMKKVIEKQACWACPLGCTRITRSRFSRQGVKGPEYETIWALGASPGVFDMDTVIEATRICDDYGLDTVSTGAVLGWYKEACEKGLTKDRWSSKRFLELIELIGERQAVGDILAEGSLRASQKFKGAGRLIAHAKGLELPAWDPRGAWGMAICYATGPTGGDHCKGWTVADDIDDKKGRFVDLKARAKGAIERQDFSVMIDSSGFCIFTDFLLGWKMFARCFKAVLGIDLTGEKLEKRARAIFNLERKINQKLGHTLKKNVLPARIIDYEVTVEGRKVKLSREDFGGMLKLYYKLRGWKN